MIYPAQTLTTVHGDRLHFPIHNLVATYASLIMAISLKLGLQAGDYSTADFVQFKQRMRMPLVGPTEGIIANQIMPSISLTIEDGHATTDDGSQSPSIQTRSLIVNMMAPMFVDYFERYRPWLESNIGKIDLWPSIIQFGRVVRNAASHGGKLHMTNKKAKPVHWRSLTYQAADHGRHVFGSDLNLPDIIFLMFDMDHELDALKCPVIGEL
jgi:hypothetical protein